METNLLDLTFLYLAEGQKLNPS